MIPEITSIPAKATQEARICVTRTTDGLSISGGEVSSTVCSQYGAVIQGWHSALLLWAGFLSVTGIIPEYFSQMTENDPEQTLTLSVNCSWPSLQNG